MKVFFKKSSTTSLFTLIPWLNGERAKYTIHRAENSRKKVHTGDIVIEYRFSEKTKNDCISLITRSKIYNPLYMEDVNVCVHKEDYRPILTRIRVQTPEGETVEVKGNYKRKRVNIVIDIPEMRQKSTIRVPLNVYDNYQAHFLLRSLGNTNVGYRTSFHAVHILKKILVNPKLTVEAKEVVDVPAGQYVCWRISSKKEVNREVQQYIFIAEKEPHPMVKNIKGSQLIELVEHVKP